MEHPRGRHVDEQAEHAHDEHAQPFHVRDVLYPVIGLEQHPSADDPEGEGVHHGGESLQTLVAVGALHRGLPLREAKGYQGEGYRHGIRDHMTGVRQQGQALGEYAADDLGEHEPGNQHQSDGQGSLADAPQVVGVVMAPVPVAMPVVVVTGMVIVIMSVAGMIIMPVMIVAVAVVTGMTLVIIMVMPGMTMFVRTVLVSAYPPPHPPFNRFSATRSSSGLPSGPIGSGWSKSNTGGPTRAAPAAIVHIACTSTRCLHYGCGGRRMNVVRTPIRHLTLVALAMSLLFLAAACGTEPEPTPETEPEMSLEDILARTGENLVALSTARFQMIDENETGAKFFGATLKNVNGEVQSPDSAKLVVEIESAALGFAEVQIVAVGDEAFMKFSAGAPWNPLPLDQVPFNFVGLGITLSDLLPLVQNAAIAGEESIGSGPAVLVEGSLVSEDLSTLITSADSGHPIDLTLWIGKADQVLRQIRITGQIFDDDGPGTSRLIILSDYGAPVEIQLPETASGT